MDDPVGDISGTTGCAAMRRRAAAHPGIDIGPYALSHLAIYRVPESDQYVHLPTSST